VLFGLFDSVLQDLKERDRGAYLRAWSWAAGAASIWKIPRSLTKAQQTIFSLRERLAAMLVVVLSATVGLFAAEIVVRHSTLGDAFVSASELPASERVAKIGAPQIGRPRLVILGDSFTIWRDSTGGSYVRVAQRLLPTTEVINLAEVGTGLAEYYQNIVLYGDKLRPAAIIIGVYVGNDLSPYSVPLGAPVVGTQTTQLLVSSSSAIDWKRLLKHSMLANLIYRVGKLYVPLLRSGLFDDTVNRLSAATNHDRTLAMRRLSLVDPKLVDAARADAINPSDLAIAIFFPDYYGTLAAAELSNLKGERFELGHVLQDLGTLIFAARRTGAKIAVVLIPPPVWVDESYQHYFRALGYRNLGPTNGPIPIIDRVKAYLAELSVPTLDTLPILRAQTKRVYLNNDVHLNDIGQKVVGVALAEFLVSKRIVEPEEN
jgi:hypothetical protein